MVKDTFQSIFQTCEKDLKNLEMWPSYFSRRYYEFLSFFELLPKKHFENTLEIGCSVGYYSAFLSTISDKVTATDQPESNIAIHSGNLAKAKQLLEHLEITNVELKPATLESLPFPDNSFDLVFSSHVLGYIPDQKKALSEIQRVLKPHGVHFCVVPSRFTTLIRLIEYYAYLSKRVTQLVTKRLVFSKPATSTETGVSCSESKKHISLFPKTQGAQEHWIEEVQKTSHNHWKKLFNSEKNAKPILQVSTQVSPTLPLISIVSPRLAAKIYGYTRKLELALGKLNVLKPFGLNVVLIQEKI